jgi:hypothetical protein
MKKKPTNPNLPKQTNTRQIKTELVKIINKLT